MTNLLTRLRELEAKATPGPWTVAGARNLSVQGMNVWAVSVNHANGDWETIFVNGACEAQAQLIAEMRNALPKLIDEIESRDAELTKLNTRLTRLLAVVEAAKKYKAYLGFKEEEETLRNLFHTLVELEETK